MAEQTPAAPAANQAAPAEADTSADTDALEATADDPAAPLAEKADAKKQLKKLKLKVDGKEIEEEYDPNDDEYMTRQFQLAKASQKRFQEFSQLEKDVRQFVDDLRKNPRKVLSDPTIGIDVKKLAAQIIEEEIENSQKSPELLAKEKLEAELKELRDQREKEKEQSKQQELQRIQQEQYERYDMLMTQALEKTDVPKSPYVVKKMADYMLLGLQSGYDVTPEDVLPLVREELQEDLKEMFRVMPDEVIEKLVGEDVFKRVRKKNIAKMKANPQAPQSLKSQVKDTGTAASSEKKENSGDKKTFKEYFGV